MWKNITEQDRPQMTIWRMRTAYRIPKATNTHSEFVVLTTFPLQTMVAKTRLNVTFKRTLPVLVYLISTVSEYLPCVFIKRQGYIIYDLFPFLTNLSVCSFMPYFTARTETRLRTVRTLSELEKYLIR